MGTTSACSIPQGRGGQGFSPQPVLPDAFLSMGDAAAGITVYPWGLPGEPGAELWSPHCKGVALEDLAMSLPTQAIPLFCDMETFQPAPRLVTGVAAAAGCSRAALPCTEVCPGLYKPSPSYPECFDYLGTFEQYQSLNGILWILKDHKLHFSEISLSDCHQRITESQWFGWEGTLGSSHSMGRETSTTPGYSEPHPAQP